MVILILAIWWGLCEESWQMRIKLLSFGGDYYFYGQLWVSTCRELMECFMMIDLRVMFCTLFIITEHEELEYGPWLRWHIFTLTRFACSVGLFFWLVVWLGGGCHQSLHQSFCGLLCICFENLLFDTGSVTYIWSQDTKVNKSAFWLRGQPGSFVMELPIHVLSHWILCPR